MTDALNTALMLMAVGMITVFTILALVVFGGNLMIILINRFAGEPIENAGTGGIGSAKIAAITAAVDAVTLGKGRISEITKK